GADLASSRAKVVMADAAVWPVGTDSSGLLMQVTHRLRTKPGAYGSLASMSSSTSPVHLAGNHRSVSKSRNPVDYCVRRSSLDGGIVRPRAFAVLTLMTTS